MKDSFTTHLTTAIVRKLLIVVLAATSFSSYAQELIVKTPLTVVNDLSASVKPRNDLNGQKCALIKVWCALDSLEFRGNVLGDVPHSNGEYWVYMSQNSKFLHIHHRQMLPLECTFDPLQSGMTYRLVLQYSDGTKAPDPTNQ